MSTFTRTARFYVRYKDSFVKLTLKPGQHIELFEGGPCEEGFHNEWTSYEYDEYDGVVRMEAYSRSRDCDGLYEHSWVGECPFSHLADLEEEWDGDFISQSMQNHWPARPDWREKTRSQRDHTAEAAGY